MFTSINILKLKKTMVSVIADLLETLYDNCVFG